jgi:hypothetical protein
MTADEFVKIVRNGSEKLRVDEIVINTGNQEMHGKGMLHISRERIELDVTINQGETLPEFQTGIYTKKDSWKMTGLIEDQLQFKCDHVGPTGNRQLSWPSGITRCKFKLHPIDLTPAGWDAMTRNDRNEILKEHAKNNPQFPAAQPTKEEESPNSVSFYATLFEYPLLATTWGNEVKGETDDFEFILTKEKPDADLHVTLNSKKNYHSAGEKEDWVKFDSFMHALAFANGIHAWPYRREYWRAGQKITDRVTSANKLTKTFHAPFTDRLAFNAQTGSLKWDFRDVIRKAAAFFEKNSTLSKEVSIILFLFREADEGVHSEITTIALCTLFENLVRLLFAELKLKEKVDNNELKLFEEAKAEIADQINSQVKEKGEGFRRLHNVVKTAQPFTMEQMFHAVVSHFELKWQDDMENIFKTWKRARNPLVHGKTRAEISEDEQKASVLDESRIAGAINILLLKLFGYSGHMRCSTFEDGYRQV